MATILKDRVKEVTTTTGTGTLTLTGTFNGYQRFTEIGNGNTTYACVYAVDASGVPTGDWEVFSGVWSTGHTLTRASVTASSNGGSAVSFAAGTKHVICCVSASILGNLLLTIPTAVSQLTNDSGFITSSSLGGASSTELGYCVGVTSAIQTQINAKADTSSIPTDTNQLTNGAGFITGITGLTISSLTNDSGYITSASIPTVVSAFTNDSGYITSGTLGGASSTELGYCVGVTSSIQTQLNSKATGTIPTLTSQLTNDSGFLTSLSGNISSFTNDSGYITSSSLGGASSTELGYCVGVTSSIQTQLNSKATGTIPTATSQLTNDSGFLTSISGLNISTLTNDSGYITSSSLGGASSTELGYSVGVTSAIQTQLDAKQATITGGATTIATSDLTVSRALVSDGSGKVAVATTTSTEISYLNGVTSAIQTQLDAKGGSTITVQKFTSGSGTYTTPANVKYIRVRMVGGGAGGIGSGTAAGTVPTAGGNTTFGSSLLVANGGGIGTWAGAIGAGGTASLGTGPIGLAFSGQTGRTMMQTTTASLYAIGGAGGSSFFGGSGYGGGPVSTGGAAATNSGSGGGGGGGQSSASTVNSGGGGGAGGYVDATITTPSSTYAYAVGAAGTAGAAGTGGYAGGAGAAGIIIVEEYY